MSSSAGLSCTAAGRSSSISGLAFVANRSSAVDRLPRRDRERRERLDRVAPARVSCAAVAANTAFELRMKPCSWAGERASRREHLAAVAQQRARRGVVATQHRQHRVDVGRERVQLGERGVEVLAAVGQRDRVLLLPDSRTPGGSPGRTSRGSGRAGPSARSARAGASRRRAASARSASRASARCRSRRAATSRAGSRACRPAAGRTGWSISITAFVRPVRRSSETAMTLPTLTPEIRTSD